MLLRRARLALPLTNICLATAGVAVAGGVSVLVGAGPALLAALVFSILFALWTVRFGGLLEVSTGG